MSEEEFDEYYQHGFRGGHKVNNENKWNEKIRYFESYTYQNGRWKETSLEQLKTDIGSDLPEVKKADDGLFWWVEKKGRDYYINSFPLVGLLYDHIHKMFLYPTPQAIIAEDLVFKSREECEKWIHDEEEKHRGEITIKTKEQLEREEQAKNMHSRFERFESFSDGNGQHFTFSF